MRNFNKIVPGDIVVLKDLISNHIGVIKICKTTQKIIYMPSTSRDFCQPNTRIAYITEEEMGRDGDIIKVSDVSPVGKSLLDEKVGNTVEVKFPTGKIRKYRILEVRSGA